MTALEVLINAQLATIRFRASDGIMSVGVRSNEEATQAALEALAEAGYRLVADYV